MVCVCAYDAMKERLDMGRRNTPQEKLLTSLKKSWWAANVKL